MPTPLYAAFQALQSPILYADPLGAPADHGVRPGLVPPTGEGDGEEAAAQAPARPADHVEIEKSNVLILVGGCVGRPSLSACMRVGVLAAPVTDSPRSAAGTARGMLGGAQPACLTCQAACGPARHSQLADGHEAWADPAE